MCDSQYHDHGVSGVCLCMCHFCICACDLSVGGLGLTYDIFPFSSRPSVFAHVGRRLDGLFRFAPPSDSHGDHHCLGLAGC